MKNKIRRILSVFLALIIITGVMPLGGISLFASADISGYSGKCGDNITWSFRQKDGLLTLSGTGNTYSYDYENNHSPFFSSNLIRSVVVEEGVTGIGNYLFYNSRLLKSVSLPESLLSVGDSAFEECEILSDIELKSRRVQYIGPYAFGNTKYCWDKNNHEDGLIYLGDCLICGIYPDENGDLKTIGDVVIKDGTRLIASCAFSHVNYAGNSGKNETLTSVTFPKGLEIINKWAFYGCTSLTSVSFPCSIKSVEDKAFTDIHGLTDFYVPKGIKAFDYRSFYGLNNCTIHYEGTQEEWENVEFATKYGTDCTIEYNSTFSIEHEYEWQTVKEPTCVEEGIYGNCCNYCGDITESKSIPVIDHTYTSVVIKEPTCTEKGVLTYTCECGDTYTEDIPFADHKLTHVKEDPTCTKAGAEYDICSECGNKFNEEEIPAIAHTYTSAVTKEPTCTEKGVLTYTCECGDTYTEDIPLADHKLTHVTKDPTCTKAGAEYDICAECGTKFNEKEIPAIAHTYTSAVTKEPTCTEKGVLTYICECGDTYTEDIPFADHKFTHYIEKETCTENGREYDICAVCGGTFNEAETKAAGHIYENGICTVCGKVEGWNYTVNNGTVTVNGYTGGEKNLEIPAEIGGYPVTAIAESAYAGNNSIESVILPNSIFIIGKNAFKGCSSLKEICISDSVSTICEGAFADCTSLAIVFIASSNAYLKGAFLNNDSRLTFIIPEGAKTVANVSEEGFAYNTFMYPKEKDGKGAIAVSGTTVLYQDLDYNYWGELIKLYPYAFYLYFDVLTFDGVNEDEIIIDIDNIDESADFLTMKEVYISISVNEKPITFRELIKLLREGKTDAVITFTDSEGVKRTFFQRIGDFFEDVFNALAKAINAIVRIFKKK